MEKNFRSAVITVFSVSVSFHIILWVIMIVFHELVTNFWTTEEQLQQRRRLLSIVKILSQVLIVAMLICNITGMALKQKKVGVDPTPPSNTIANFLKRSFGDGRDGRLSCSESRTYNDNKKHAVLYYCYYSDWILWFIYKLLFLNITFYGTLVFFEMFLLIKRVH